MLSLEMRTYIEDGTRSPGGDPAGRQFLLCYLLGGEGGEGYLFRAALDQFFSRAGICFPDILPLVPSGFN